MEDKSSENKLGALSLWTLFLNLFGVIASAVALLPVFFLWLLIRLQDGRPGFFVQSRLGKDERTFQLFKLRTMPVGTPIKPTHEVKPEIATPLGHFLRRSKLDEIPQFINVLLGHMNLVGPRPCLPEQEVLIGERRRREIFSVKPGITGWAQVHGVDMSDVEEICNYDLEYLQKRSIAMDIQILVKTFARIFS